MGKACPEQRRRGRDRARAIETITPTFVLPRQGKEIRALPPVGFFMSRATANPKISKELDRITIIPDVCGGEPTIREIRFALSQVLEMLAGG